MPKACSRCGNCHTGILIYAPNGWMVLFRSDWENSLEDWEFYFWRDNVAPLKRRKGDTRQFIAAANW